jgi:hypothetical protein
VQLLGALSLFFYSGQLLLCRFMTSFLVLLPIVQSQFNARKILGHFLKALAIVLDDIVAPQTDRGYAFSSKESRFVGCLVRLPAMTNILGMLLPSVIMDGQTLTERVIIEGI